MSELRPNDVDVLHLLYSYKVGGMERVVLDMMRARRGSPVRYGVAVMNNDYSEDMLEQLRATGVAVFLLGRSAGSRSPAPFLRLMTLLSKHRVKLVHTREPTMIPIALMMKLARPGARFLGSFHNTNLTTLSPGVKIWTLNNVYSRFVAISNAVKAEVQARGVRRDITVMNNAVDTARFANAPRTESADGALRLICVARYYLHQKAQDRLLEAVAVCKARGVRLHLSLVGNVDGRNDADYRALQAIVAERGLEDTVTFVVNQTNVHEHLAKADLFVLPSHFEGFGNVVIEAMAAGLPVLVSEVDGMKEIVTGDVDGMFIRPANVEDMVERICWASENREQLATIGTAGQKRAANFDISNYAARYEAIYLETIGASGVPKGPGGAPAVSVS